MVVCGVGYSRESHGSLLGLGTLGSLTVVCWDWVLQGVLWESVGIEHSRR